FGVRPVDLRSPAIRALRGLLVGAFHESDSRAIPNQPLQVARRPLQVRLEADSNAAVALEEPFAKPNRIIRGRGAFHVEPQDPAIRLRRIEDGQHLGQGVLLLDEDAELGRLDADFAADPLRSHRCEELEILAGCRLHRCLFSVMLSELVHDRLEAVFALPTPVTTPTSRKIHHRRMSQPPIPASTPPMTKRMIAPTKDSKKAVTEKEELVAAPIVPVRKLRNPYRIITIPTMRKAAPTRRTVTAPQPNGRLGAALWTGAGAYGEGAAMGSAVLRIAVGFGTASISPRINVSLAFPAVVLTSVGSGKSRFALFLVSRAVEQCLKSHRRQSDIDGLPIEARSSPHPRRRLRTREAGRRNGPWPHPCRPDAR